MRGFIAAASLDLSLPWATSLKDRRKPVAGMRERLRRMGISCTDISAEASVRHARLVLAATGESATAAEARIAEAIELVDAHPDLVMASPTVLVHSFDELD